MEKEGVLQLSREIFAIDDGKIATGSPASEELDSFFSEMFTVASPSSELLSSSSVENKHIFSFHFQNNNKNNR